MRVMAIDPGASAGFAVVERDDGGARVLWCAQAAPVATSRREVWAGMLDAALAVGAERCVIEAPCYAANQGRRAGVSAALGERVGELRGMAWARFADVSSADWRVWQRLPGWAEPMEVGPELAERRSRRYAMDVLGVPRAWLMGPRGAILDDAATACCIGAAVVLRAAYK